jgi:hypothetical protein
LKDVNFIDRGKKVFLQNSELNDLQALIKSDSEFLASQGIMDYSLLLVEEKLTFLGQGSKNKLISQDGTIQYHLGIIDFLQTWDVSKKFESTYKQIVLKQDPKLISAMEPQAYADRFQRFVSQQVLH